MNQPEILGSLRSTCTRAVCMLCEEKAIDYRLTETPLNAPALYAVHPLGRMPVLRHGDVELFESKAIATYLDLGFPGVHGGLPGVELGDIAPGHIEQSIASSAQVPCGVLDGPLPGSDVGIALYEDLVEQLNSKPGAGPGRVVPHDGHAPNSAPN